MTTMFIWAIFAYPAHGASFADAQGQFRVAYRSEQSCEKNLQYQKVSNWTFRCVKMPVGQ